MRSYRVRIPSEVQAQIDEQAVYIARDSMEQALLWHGRLRKAILTIGEVIGYAVDENASARLGREVRQFVFERTYLVHYCVDDDAGVVELIGFRHGARQPRRAEP